MRTGSNLCTRKLLCDFVLEPARVEIGTHLIGMHLFEFDPLPKYFLIVIGSWITIENWPKTASGLPSTAGTTASVAFIRKGKLYTGHVGDSRIVIGLKEPGVEEWQAESLTIDHKPECPREKQRILDSGGLVMNKSGVERVVWKRPRPGHEGPILRSTDFEKIPFLAVARSL
ncbi:Protein phosphatase 1D, partial [Araneus ventricosus]